MCFALEIMHIRYQLTMGYNVTSIPTNDLNLCAAEVHVATENVEIFSLTGVLRIL